MSYYKGYEIDIAEEDGIVYSMVFQQCGDIEFRGKMCFSVSDSTVDGSIRKAQKCIDVLKQPYWRIAN